MNNRRRVTAVPAVLVLLALVLPLVSASPVVAATAEAKRVVNINSADSAQLALLPRVGPSVAQRIVEHRKTNGGFKKVEDLMLVRGIGEKTFALIRPYLAISGETTLKEKAKAAKTEKAPGR